METKRLIEILELLKLYLTEKAHYGICETFAILEAHNNVNCTTNELARVQQYIYDNKPTLTNQYSEYMNNEKWLGKRFWWDRICDAPETRQIRINFLTALIDNIK